MHHYYEAELEAICNKLLYMGQRCVESVRMAMTALLDNDGELAREVIRVDDEIDQLEKSIDAECVRYISLRNPVAKDLRLLTLAMRACHDLERVGDEASSIAKRVPDLSGQMPLKLKSDELTEIMDRVLIQLQDAIACFINRDAKEALTITLRDKDIDLRHRAHIARLIKNAKADNEAIDDAVDLIFISKSLERVGDHAKNVAEEVIYLMEGEDIRHTRKVKQD